MLSNGPMLTVFLGFAVVMLATLLMRQQIFPAAKFGFASPSVTIKPHTRIILGLGGVTVSLLAFFIVLWELVG